MFYPVLNAVIFLKLLQKIPNPLISLSTGILMTSTDSPRAQIHALLHVGSMPPKLFIGRDRS